MAYCDQDDILARVPRNELIQLSDIDDEGTINTATVTSAITRAASFIDSYVKKRRTVPMSPAPQEALDMNTTLAIYYLHEDRHSITDDLKAAFERIKGWLEAYVEGTVSFSDDEDPDSPAASGKQTHGDSDFTRDDLEGW